MCDLLKIAAVGEKCGYAGGELAKYIENELKRMKEEEAEKLKRFKQEEAEKLQRIKEEEAEKLKQEIEKQEREYQRQDKLRREKEEREDKLRQEDEAREVRRFQREQGNKEKEYELEMVKATQKETIIKPLTRYPDLPAFVESTDKVDSYLNRFERYATNAQWPRKGWATQLSALLTGEALEVYFRLSDADANNYDKLKEALLRRYDFTEDGYRNKFRQGKPIGNESPEQFVERLRDYLYKWVEMSKTEKTFHALAAMFVKEQFMNCVQKELAVYLRQHNPTTLEEMAGVANRYLIAHGQKLQGVTLHHSQSVTCYKCGLAGHMAPTCPSNQFNDSNAGLDQRKCFNCNEIGHIARDCKAEKGAGAVQLGDGISEDHLVLADGTIFPVVEVSAMQSTQRVNRMPVATGMVGARVVNVLRDTGCSSVVIKKDLVQDNQYNGQYMYMLLIDKTVRKVPVAQVDIDTPYFTGQVDALCLPDSMYDLIIGNIDGARSPDDPDSQLHLAGAVTTRLQSKKSINEATLKVNADIGIPTVTKQELINLQQNDASIRNARSRIGQGANPAKTYTSNYEEDEGILYRVYTDKNGGKAVRQVVVPQQLRQSVMDIAHSSIMAGHLGVRKTMDRILSNFFWPGIKSDVTQYCHSCDVCQKTVAKGRVGKVPLQSMPIIDQPFKRVAIDLIGPIKPASDMGHRYILTVVDYATRYPEAIPLKTVTTEAVAEALMDVFCRIGVPEEILSDLGSQMVSDCMKEVMRLMSVNQLTTTPYHPMCNGLVERFNGTLKTMLRRLCSEQPKAWHRYINPLLFAYREVPHESTGFSPFELMYGRTVRGPMMILKELWTKEGAEDEIKTSYQFVLELRNRLEETLNIAHEALRRSQANQKRQYDRKARTRTFDVDDEVLILLPTDNNKLLMQWKGPFKVEEVMGVNDYKVRIRGKSKVYHANLLKKYIRRDDSIAAGVGILIAGDHDDMIGVEMGGSVAVIEPGEGDEDQTIDDEGLLDIVSCKSKENYRNVNVGENLSEEQKLQLSAEMLKNEEIFTDVPGSTSLETHHIRLKSDEPIRSRPYTIPYSVRELLRSEIKEMLDHDIIRKSNSPYTSPVVIVRKKDGSNRICID